MAQLPRMLTTPNSVGRDRVGVVDDRSAKVPVLNPPNLTDQDSRTTHAAHQNSLLSQRAGVYYKEDSVGHGDHKYRPVSATNKACRVCRRRKFQRGDYIAEWQTKETARWQTVADARARGASVEIIGRDKDRPKIRRIVEPPQQDMTVRRRPKAVA